MAAALIARFNGLLTEFRECLDSGLLRNPALSITPTQ